jgi:hypothetical protein
LDFSRNERRVPHISLVFREMWDSTALHRQTLGVKGALKVRDSRR